MPMQFLLWLLQCFSGDFMHKHVMSWHHLVNKFGKYAYCMQMMVLLHVITKLKVIDFVQNIYKLCMYLTKAEC